MSWIDNLAQAGNIGMNLASFGYNIFARERARKDFDRYRREDWSREDNAIQRRVADLKAAGINPLLAAGQPAAASATASHTAPAPIDAPNLLQMIQAREEIAITRAERQRLKAETERIKAETEESQSRALSQERQRDLWATEIDLNEQQKMFRELSNPLDIETRKLANNIKQKISDLEASNIEVRNNLLQRQLQIEELYDQSMARIKEFQALTEAETAAIEKQRQQLRLEIEQEYSMPTAEAELLSKDLSNEALSYNLQHAQEAGGPIGHSSSGGVIAGTLSWIMDFLRGLGNTVQQTFRGGLRRHQRSRD